MREPVEPASIIRAHWTIGLPGCGDEQCVVLAGSGSVAKERGVGGVELLSSDISGGGIGFGGGLYV